MKHEAASNRISSGSCRNTVSFSLILAAWLKNYTYFPMVSPWSSPSGRNSKLLRREDRKDKAKLLIFLHLPSQDVECVIHRKESRCSYCADGVGRFGVGMGDREGAAVMIEMAGRTNQPFQPLISCCHLWTQRRGLWSLYIYIKFVAAMYFGWFSRSNNASHV